MHLPPPFIYPKPATEPPALVRVISREEVFWNRPSFKAPSLEVRPPAAVVAPFSTGRRKH